MEEGLTCSSPQGRDEMAVLVAALEQSLPTPEREKEIRAMIREKKEQIEALEALLPLDPEETVREVE